MSPAAPGPTPGMARTVRGGKAQGTLVTPGASPGLRMLRAGAGAAVTVPAEGMRRDPRGRPPPPAGRPERRARDRGTRRGAGPGAEGGGRGPVTGPGSPPRRRPHSPRRSSTLRAGAAAPMVRSAPSSSASAHGRMAPAAAPAMAPAMAPAPAVLGSSSGRPAPPLSRSHEAAPAAQIRPGRSHRMRREPPAPGRERGCPGDSRAAPAEPPRPAWPRPALPAAPLVPRRAGSSGPRGVLGRAAGGTGRHRAGAAARPWRRRVPGGAARGRRCGRRCPSCAGCRATRWPGCSWT